MHTADAQGRTQGTCLFETIAEQHNFTDLTLGSCLDDYKDLTLCYEKNCQFGDYIYAMNTTNSICSFPPRDRGPTQTAIGAVFLSLTIFIFALRLMGRPPFTEAFGADDVVALIAFVTSIGITVNMLVAVTEKAGVDIWALDLAETIKLMIYLYVGQLFFYVSAVLTKLAMLFFYIRIFSTSIKVQSYVVIGLCIAFGLTAVFQSAFNCSPPSYYWMKFDGVSQGSCLSFTASKSMPMINVILDIVVMVLTVPPILRLNLPLRKKIRVISMFCVGIFIIIASAVRIAFLYPSISSYNLTYDSGEMSYFAIIECEVSVMCTCMPAIAVLLKRFCPRWFGSSRDRGYSAPRGGDRVASRQRTFPAGDPRTSSTTKTDSPNGDRVQLIYLRPESTQLPLTNGQ